MSRRIVPHLMWLALLALPGSAQAQQQPPPVVWPDPPAAQRPAPGQPPATRPPARPRPARPAPAPVVDDPAVDAAPPTAPKPAAAAQNIRCDGPFAKDSSHAKLVQAFGAKNVTQAGGAPGAGGSTVLFPNDPKRRLEVTWHDAAARSRPASIAVEGKSAWRARGFRIGEPLANVEKTNGKPFKLGGFEGELGGAARDWEGGALDKLSGGCQLGMRFAPDPSALQEARGKVSGDREFQSDNPDIRAVRPAITELIIGYPQ
jgi:hypothetical protein